MGAKRIDAREGWEYPSPMFTVLPFPCALTTRWVGHPLLFVAEVDSTNRLLRAQGAAGAAEGTVLVTDFQEAGRGRLGRAWRAPPGSSLLLSLLLRPATLLPHHALLPLVLAVAVARTLERHLGLRPDIKWPNDVRLGGQKVCGILVESESEGHGARMVAGIGLNVNQTPADLAALPDATSLRCIVGRPLPHGPLLAALLAEVERACDEWADGWSPHAAWRRRAPWLGQPIVVHPTNGAAWHGLALDLAEDGALLVQRDDGRPVALHAGDVSVRVGPE